MKILGVAPYLWISSAALVEDGRVIAAAAEERFNRVKGSKAFPSKAIDYCLKEAGCSLDEIDRIAVAWNPGMHIRSASSRYISDLRWRGEYLINIPASLLNVAGNPDVDQVEELIRMSGNDMRITFVNHHQAHAACAFFLSPFDQAAILTVDGRGENESVTWSMGGGSQIKKLSMVRFPHSLGEFYSAVTQFLGYRAYEDEWKIMALASYGTPDNEYYPRIRSLIRRLDRGQFELDLSYFSYYLFDMQPTMYTKKLPELLGMPRQKEEPLEQRHRDIAWALQQVFGEMMTYLLTHLHALTGESRVALAGGSAMNSVYNGKIREATPFHDVFVPSCPDDSGAPVGAALHVYHCLEGGEKKIQPLHNYWGPAYTDREIEESLKQYKIVASRCDNVVEATAKLLMQGKLVGWFQGKMEFGQRALGNRSILADPRNPAAKDLINAAVKYREGFRPFAPAVVAESAWEYFDIPVGDTVPFMEKVYRVKPGKKAVIPAVVHVDDTGRLQTVSRETNPAFYDLIRHFGALTGVPVVLNTSFNLNGEPIVCSPKDAIRTFYSCGLDALVMGNWLILKQR